MVIDIIIGLASGFVSGLLVYYLTKRREDKCQTYYFLYDYLFSVMQKARIEVPSELCRYASRVGDTSSAWGKSIMKVMDLNRKYDISNRTFTEYDAQLAEAVTKALQELNAWGEKNHIVKQNHEKEA